MTEEDPYRVVMLFQRKKDNPDLKKSTICVFQDCARTSQIIKRTPLYERLATELNARAYVSVNARNIKNAQRALLHRLLNTLNDAAEETNLIGQTIGSLMQCPRRENKLFLIDVDTKEAQARVDVMNKLRPTTAEVVTTKNGCHLIIPACDTTSIEGMKNVEIKKDGMTNLSWLTQRTRP